MLVSIKQYGGISALSAAYKAAQPPSAGRASWGSFGVYSTIDCITAFSKSRST